MHANSKEFNDHTVFLSRYLYWTYWILSMYIFLNIFAYISIFARSFSFSVNFAWPCYHSDHQQHHHIDLMSRSFCIGHIWCRSAGQFGKCAKFTRSIRRSQAIASIGPHTSTEYGWRSLQSVSTTIYYSTNTHIYNLDHPIISRFFFSGRIFRLHPTTTLKRTEKIYTEKTLLIEREKCLYSQKKEKKKWSVVIVVDNTSKSQRQRQMRWWARRAFSRNGLWIERKLTQKIYGIHCEPHYRGERKKEEEISNIYIHI